MAGREIPRAPESVRFDPENVTVPAFQVVDFERQASFFMTGGLVAVRSEGRSRDAIWSSLKRREVYGTSGERILLWFDLLNGPDGPVGMGGESWLGAAPRFRVRPQARPGEPVAPLIEDPWKRFDCEPSADGCVVEFEDTDFVDGGRDATYYVRAIQAPTPAVNAGGLRCRYDEEGNCVEPNLCYGDYRTSFDDDCLSPTEERAWSSPIYLSHAAELAAR